MATIRLFVWLSRMVRCAQKVMWSTVKFSKEFTQIAVGMAALRFAWRVGSLRLALGQWCEEVAFGANWDYAVK